MVHPKFESYQLACEFYRASETLRVPAHLRSQLLRASSSVVLNLSEGAGRYTDIDRRRFYQIALGSLREVQAILELNRPQPRELMVLADRLGAMVFRLCFPRERKEP